MGKFMVIWGSKAEMVDPNDSIWMPKDMLLLVEMTTVPLSDYIYSMGIPGS